MSRAVLLALLVGLALPLGVAGAQPVATASGAGTGAAAPVAASHGDPVADPVAGVHRASLDEVAILTLGGGRTGFAHASADVGTALAVERTRAGARLDRYALVAEFRATGSTEARQTLLFESATDVEIRLNALRGETRRLQADYANRTIGPEAFLVGLGHLDARAEALEVQLAAIEARADEVPQFSMDARIQQLEASLHGLDGPVREHVLATAAGEASAGRYYLRASTDGVVLTTLDGNRFVRETYRADSQNTEAVGGTSFSEAVAITETLYAPFAYNESLTVGNSLVGPRAGVYVFTMRVDAGAVTAYLDGATRRVFFEVQTRQVDRLVPPPGVVGVDNGTRLVANRSYAGGPMRLVVTDEASGEPVATTVDVGGHVVTTGDDGVAWTLAPPEPVEVTAAGPSGNVTITVRPFQPTAVGDREG